MTRTHFLIPALAIVALLAATPVAAAPTATSKAHSASIKFELAANHGLQAHLETFNGEVTLEISRKDRLATYEIFDGESTEAGLKAKFGKLGLIDVAFSPTKTRTEKPPKECDGAPSIWSEGLFVGTIEFTGEREYVRIEAAEVKGTMSVDRESEWQCRRHKGPKRIQGARRPSALDSPRRPEAEREPATLGASSRRCSCYFAAYAKRGRKGRGPTSFVGVKFETREGMEIVRATGVRAGPSTFVFDHAAGTARVNPPPPFSGNATFKRRPHSRDLWRSTIRAPFLGANPVSIYGPDFRAALIRDLPDD